MALAGLILEMLIPGLVFTTSMVVVVSEFSTWKPPELNTGQAVLFGFGILIFSYLVGVVFRHWRDFVPKSTFLDDNTVAMKTLNTDWSSLIPDLIKKWSASWPNPLRYDLSSEDGSPEVSSEDGSPEVDVDNAGLLIGVMRDKLLAKEAQAWADYLMYQWNLARLARNNFLPVSLAAIVTIAGVVNRFVGDDTIGVVLYAIATFLLVFIAVGLVRVHKTRIGSHVGILVRTSTELGHPKVNGS